MAGLGVAYSTEIVEVNTGKDWYYGHNHDAIKSIVWDPVSKSYKSIPYDHAPKVPDGFRSRTECTLSGFPFEPRKFWSQGMDKQLLFLKDPIVAYDLLAIVSKHRDIGLKRYLTSPTGKPYSMELELQFEKAIWETLRQKYEISFEQFTSSIRSMLIPEDRLYSAPLIIYFADKLAPRYEFHYSGFNQMLNKVIKLPSEFEVLTGKPNKGEVVYNRFK